MAIPTRLMSREEVAELLGISPRSVSDTLRRYGITEERGYPREAVERLDRPGRGWRKGRPGGRTQTAPTNTPEENRMPSNDNPAGDAA